MKNTVNVLLTGELLHKQTTQDAVSVLSKLFKLDEQQAEKMLAKAPLAIKKNVDRGTAERFVSALARSGFGAYIEPVAALVEAELPEVGTEPVVAPALVSVTSEPAEYNPQPILSEQERLAESLDFSLVIPSSANPCLDQDLDTTRPDSAAIEASAPREALAVVAPTMEMLIAEVVEVVEEAEEAAPQDAAQNFPDWNVESIDYSLGIPEASDVVLPSETAACDIKPAAFLELDALAAWEHSSSLAPTKQLENEFAEDFSDDVAPAAFLSSALSDSAMALGGSPLVESLSLVNIAELVDVQPTLIDTVNAAEVSDHFLAFPSNPSTAMSSQDRDNSLADPLEREIFAFENITHEPAPLSVVIQDPFTAWDAAPVVPLQEQLVADAAELPARDSVLPEIAPVTAIPLAAEVAEFKADEIEHRLQAPLVQIELSVGDTAVGLDVDLALGDFGPPVTIVDDPFAAWDETPAVDFKAAPVAVEQAFTAPSVARVEIEQVATASSVAPIMAEWLEPKALAPVVPPSMPVLEVAAISEPLVEEVVRDVLVDKLELIEPGPAVDSVEFSLGLADFGSAPDRFTVGEVLGKFEPVVAVVEDPFASWDDAPALQLSEPLAAIPTALAFTVDTAEPAVSNLPPVLVVEPLADAVAFDAPAPLVFEAPVPTVAAVDAPLPEFAMPVADEDLGGFGSPLAVVEDPLASWDETPIDRPTDAPLDAISEAIAWAAEPAVHPQMVAEVAAELAESVMAPIPPRVNRSELAGFAPKVAMVDKPFAAWDEAPAYAHISVPSVEKAVLPDSLLAFDEPDFGEISGHDETPAIAKVQSPASDTAPLDRDLFTAWGDLSSLAQQQASPLAPAEAAIIDEEQEARRIVAPRELAQAENEDFQMALETTAEDAPLSTYASQASSFTRDAREAIAADAVRAAKINPPVYAASEPSFSSAADDWMAESQPSAGQAAQISAEVSAALTAISAASLAEAVETPLVDVAAEVSKTGWDLAKPLDTDWGSFDVSPAALPVNEGDDRRQGQATAQAASNFDPLLGFDNVKPAEARLTSLDFSLASEPSAGATLPVQPAADSGDWAFSVDAESGSALLAVSVPPGQSLKVEASSATTLSENLQLSKPTQFPFMRLLSPKQLAICEIQAREQMGDIVISPAVAGELVAQSVVHTPIFLRAASFVAATSAVIMDAEGAAFARQLISADGASFMYCSGAGQLWFSAAGRLVELDVQEDYLVNLDNLVAFSAGLNCDMHLAERRTGLFANRKWICRFSGQGKVWVQTQADTGGGFFTRLRRLAKV